MPADTNAVARLPVPVPMRFDWPAQGLLLGAIILLAIVSTWSAAAGRVDGLGVRPVTAIFLGTSVGV